MRFNELKHPIDVFFPIYLFVILFVSANVASTAHASIYLPHIHLNEVLLETSIIGITLIVSLILYRFNHIDCVAGLLLLRIVILFLPLFYIPFDDYALGNAIPYFISFAVYVILMQRKTVINDLYFWVKCFTGLLILQCILLFLLSPVPYTNYLYKYYYVTAAGGSNYLAALLLPCLILVGAVETKYKKYVWWTVGLITLFLIKSRTGLFVFLFISFIDLIAYIRKNKVKVIDRKKVIASLIFIIAFVLSIFIFKDFYQSFLQGYTSSYKGLGILDSLSSGRVLVFLEYLDPILNHPLLGNGLSYTFNITVPHFFPEEIVYVNGIIGLILNTALFLFILKKKKNILWDRWSVGLLFAIISILVQALFEKTMFTCNIEFLLWTFIACLLNHTKDNQVDIKQATIDIQESQETSLERE